MQRKMGIISNISTSLLESLFQLVALLDNSESKPPNQVKTNASENGLSCSIVILAIAIIDSAIGRAKYINNIEPKENSIKVFQTVTNDIALADRLEEIYAARDSIVHNHLWQGEIRWRQEDYELEYVNPPILLPGFGDKKLKRVLDEATRGTHKLGINLVPIRIWRRDAYIVLQTMQACLLALEEIDRNYVYISQLDFIYKEDLSSITQIVSSLKIPSQS